MSRIAMNDVLVATMSAVGVSVFVSVAGLMAGCLMTPEGPMYFSGGLYLLDEPEFLSLVLRAFLWALFCGLLSSIVCLWFVKNPGNLRKSGSDSDSFLK